jgi:hypothetical protein
MEKKQLKAAPSEGEDQIGRLNTALQPMIVLVTDADGLPLRHVPVDWRRIDDGQGFMDVFDAETNSDGTAGCIHVPTEGGKFRIECYVGEDRSIIIPFTGMVDDGEGNMCKTRPSGRRRMTAHPRREAPELNPEVIAPDDPEKQAKFAYPPRGASYPSPEAPVAVAPVAPKAKPAPKTEPMAALPPPAPMPVIEHRFFGHELDEPVPPPRRRSSPANVVLGAAAAMLVAAIAVMGCMLAFGGPSPDGATMRSDAPAPASATANGIATNP